MVAGSMSVASEGDLAAAAAAAAECVGVGMADSVLVVFNDEQRVIAEALASAARQRADAVQLLPFLPLSRHGEEPPAEVAEAMARADVVFAPTSYSLTQTQARIEATKGGTRFASMPTITEGIFRRAVRVDYAELRRRGEALAIRLSAASTVRVTSVSGTDIVVSLRGRTGRSDDGSLQESGAVGNLPAGEAYVAPVEAFGDGVIIIDGSLAGYGLLGSPLRLTVEAGRVVEASGEAGEWLLNVLDAGGERGRSLAELGIGTNPAAILSGNVLEDEKVIGTAHLAFGANLGIGGANAAAVHIDGVLVGPTVALDGDPVLQGGQLVLPEPH